jgi:hypothetical protein
MTASPRSPPSKHRQPPPTTAKEIARLKAVLAKPRGGHERALMGQRSLKAAHIYCVINGLSSQQFGPLLERYICERFGYTRARASDAKGDATDPATGKTTEIKVSFGGPTRSRFNFVQLRPAHKCSWYLLTAYNICDTNADQGGELFVFRVPAQAVRDLIVSYGGYAHGTVKEQGPVTRKQIEDPECEYEYALRPVLGDNCWKELLKFRVNECDL